MRAQSYVEGYHSISVPEKPNYDHISIEPLTLALGATITEVDLSNIKSNRVYSEIADALWRYHVIFLMTKI